MKKPIVFLLVIALLLPALALAGQAAEEPALYTGQVKLDLRILAEADLAAVSLGTVPKNRIVEILDVDPFWLKIRYNGISGFIRRTSMIDTSVKTVNPAITPPYSTVECEWLAWVKGEAPILKAPEAGAEALITMYDGARLALIDITDGWGRLIYHRQYAYVNTNLLSEIQPINKAAHPGDDAPLAAYTSFYRITTDDSNKNRMVNLQVACDRFELYTLANGDILDFNEHIGPYSPRVGYLPANALVKGEVVQSYGGGTCQVSSTLYNVILQLPGFEIVRRRAHGPSAAPYLPHGADAAVGNKVQNFIIRSNFDFPVRIDGTAQDGALTIAVYRAD